VTLTVVRWSWQSRPCLTRRATAIQFPTIFAPWVEYLSSSTVTNPSGVRRYIDWVHVDWSYQGFNGCYGGQWPGCNIGPCKVSRAHVCVTNTASPNRCASVMVPPSYHGGDVYLYDFQGMAWDTGATFEAWVECSNQRVTGGTWLAGTEPWNANQSQIDFRWYRP
jgi:hypothetical protein